MCGSAPMPPDNSVELAMIEQRAAREAARQEQQAEKRDERRFNRNLSGAFDSALQQARDYFTSQGASSDDYMTQIMNNLNATRGMVPFLDMNPGSYFAGAGEKAYKSANDEFINKQMQTLRQLLPQNYATNRITDDVDDATIEAILGEHQSEAQKYIDNLLSRGVITNAGHAGALKNITGQAGTAKAKLNEFGQSVIESGRGDIDKIIGAAQQAASQLKLGDQFDPYSYQNNALDKLQSFFDNIGGNLRAKVSGPLFDTSGLAGIAGASQGAQNTKFNPQALAGVLQDDEEEKDKTTTATTTPFG